MGGYENYFSYLSQGVLAGLPDGENKAFRVSRAAGNVFLDKQLKRQKMLEKQGFRRSSISLDDLDLEVQLPSCTEVFSVSLLRYL